MQDASSWHGLVQNLLDSLHKGLRGKQHRDLENRLAAGCGAYGLSLVVRNGVAQHQKVVRSTCCPLPKLFGAMRDLNQQTRMLQDESPGVQQNRVETINQDTSIC